MAATYTVTQQTRVLTLQPDNTTRESYDVTFATVPSGVVGVVNVPYSATYADDVAAAIQPIAAALEAVAES